MYLASQREATQNFGLPLPEDGADIAWWLRLKGTRDVVSGLVLLGLIAWGEPRVIGIVLLIEAIIPLGDRSLITAARGSTKRAFGIHGLTAALMVVVGHPPHHRKGLRCSIPYRSGP
ncbi:DUF4267 domain-containing protein, partial [Roseomonas sp. DSM 102946]|nr:DUF4267 domain-containing protein [Roseomonas sp. DSM 102946]